MTEPPLTLDPDLEWVQRAQRGELAAFEQLVDRYQGRIYSLALRMLRQPEDAEDVTQQTFLSALEHLHGFRGDSRFSTCCSASPPTPR